jgi:hypothetical protein
MNLIAILLREPLTTHNFIGSFFYAADLRVFFLKHCGNEDLFFPS